MVPLILPERVLTENLNPVSVRHVGVYRYNPDCSSAGEMDSLAVEEPLEIRVSFRRNGILVNRPISITMRSPGLDSELAAGFLFTEGIIDSVNSIESITCDQGSSVNVRLSHEVDLERLNRNFFVSSSCGICGKASLEAIGMNRLIQLPDGQPRHSPAFLTRLPAAVCTQQSVFKSTGGLHAAAFVDTEQNLIRLGEDVGRHNAVDKVIGAELLAGRSRFGDLLLFLSGRAGFELVQKSLMAGVPFVAAVGAPSSLSVDLARRYNSTLVGFLRDHRFNVYSGISRLKELAESYAFASDRPQPMLPRIPAP